MLNAWRTPKGIVLYPYPYSMRFGSFSTTSTFLRVELLNRNAPSFADSAIDLECCVYPTPDCCPRFYSQARQVFHRCGVGDLVRNLFRNDITPIIGVGMKTEIKWNENNKDVGMKNVGIRNGDFPFRTAEPYGRRSVLDWAAHLNSFCHPYQSFVSFSQKIKWHFHWVSSPKIGHEREDS